MKLLKPMANNRLRKRFGGFNATKAYAVVVGDVEGYSLLKRKYADSAERALSAFFEDVHQHAEKQGGSIVKWLPDGFLAGFPSVDSAIDFAEKIQTRPKSKSQPEQLTIGGQIRARLAIHYGTVQLVEASYGPDLIGSTVVEAAKLSRMIDGGQVLVSFEAKERMQHNRSLEPMPDWFLLHLA